MITIRNVIFTIETIQVCFLFDLSFKKLTNFTKLTENPVAQTYDLGLRGIYELICDEGQKQVTQSNLVLA